MAGLFKLKDNLHLRPIEIEIALVCFAQRLFRHGLQDNNFANNLFAV